MILSALINPPQTASKSSKLPVFRLICIKSLFKLIIISNAFVFRISCCMKPLVFSGAIKFLEVAPPN